MLEKQVLCECIKPEVHDGTTIYRYTCRTCTQRWIRKPGMKWIEDPTAPAARGTWVPVEDETFVSPFLTGSRHA